MSLGFGFMSSGRGSSEQENAQFQAFSAGLFSGDGVVPSSGMTVSIVGLGSSPQVFIGANPSSYNYVLDETETQGFTITAPTTNSRVATIVAAASGTAIRNDTPEARNPAECEWFVVYGASAASPTAPDETAIRDAITAQTTKGLNGAIAIVAPVANITVDNSTTTITAPLISNLLSYLDTDKLAPASILPSHLSPDFYNQANDTETVVPGYFYQDSQVYSKTWSVSVVSGSSPQTVVTDAINSLGVLLKLEACDGSSDLPYYVNTGFFRYIKYDALTNSIVIEQSAGIGATTAVITVYYTKSS